MAHDGSEGLSPDGWLPDRISVGVLTRVFTPELVDAAVEDAGAREQRRRLLPARLMVYFVLALWLFRGRNCGYGQVMTKLADGLYHQRRAGDLLAGQHLDPGGWVDAGQGRRWKPPNISSLSRGRGKLGPAPVRFLFEQVAGPIGEAGTPGVFCCGLRVVSIDGSTSDVPDSPANDEHFGRPSNQVRDGAFPQVRWLAAAESGTGSLLGASLGPYRDSEQALARDLLGQGCFGPGMLVLADRKFLSWALAREFLATGAHILWRASTAFTLKPVKVLEDGTYLAQLMPPRKSDGPPLTVRVIEYTVHTAPEDGGGEETSEVFCLATDLLDPGEYPALDLACCYPRRWGCETVIGHHKTDMGEGQPVLRSKDPAGAEQEMWALFAVYQAICKITGIGAAAAGIPPGKISFPHALAAATDTVAAFSP
ncbi:MAG TPA: IS4 family transposase [Streptosporangiaceae bacterium]|nr:IS4 family transposase [Streptosporangiaceae bacterium]